MSNLQNTITPDSHLRCAFPVSSVVAHHSDRDETTQDREETGRGVASSSAAAGPPGARARVACRGPEDSVYLAFHNRRQMIATSAKILPGVCIPDFRRIHLFSYQIFKQNLRDVNERNVKSAIETRMLKRFEKFSYNFAQDAPFFFWPTSVALHFHRLRID